MLRRTHYENVLQAAQEEYALLPLQGDAQALVTRRGARVLGIFPSPDSDNLLWTDELAWRDAEHLRQFIAQGKWNMGGERVWIAPEIQFNVRDRSDFWGTLHVPEVMDPGHYTLEVTPGRLHLHAEMSLDAYNLTNGRQKLIVQRDILPARNPLANMSAVVPDVRYCGYQHRVRLQASDVTIVAEAWNLVQVPAGGSLIIPCMPEVACSEYFGEAPDDVHKVHQGDVPHLRLHLDGKRQYKVGYQAISMLGRMAYLRRLQNGQMSLLIRSFFNNPSNPYSEEAPNKVGYGGHSIHVYNDGGEFGGDASFGEMECNGTTIHPETMTNRVQDDFVMWAYTGSEASIHAIVRLLLGVRL